MRSFLIIFSTCILFQLCLGSLYDQDGNDQRELRRRRWRRKPRKPKPTPVPSPSLFDVANSKNLSNFTSALGQIDHDLDVCKGWSRVNFTVFGPTDAVFNALDENLVNITKLLTEPAWNDHLESLLEYHVVRRKRSLLSSDLTLGRIIRTLAGKINITSISPNITINDDANVVDANNFGCQGVLHVIDSVLLPSSATDNLVDLLSSQGRFEAFLNYTTLFGLNSTLESNGPFSLFVPRNSALLDADLESQTSQEQLDVIKYHISTDFGLVDAIDNLNDGDSLGVETLLGTNFTITKTSWRGRSDSDSSDSDSRDSRSRRELKGGSLYRIEINGEKIAVKDIILANNGVIFVLNDLIRLESVFPTPSAAPSTSLAPSSSPKSCSNNWNDNYCERYSRKCGRNRFKRNCGKTCGC